MALVLGGAVIDMPQEGCAERAAPDPWLAYVGSVIRQTREEAGLTAEGLGQAVQITQSHISHIEAGSARPSTATLFKILRYLQIHPRDAFEPRIPAEHLNTVDLYLRADARAQKLVRDLLVLFDTETLAAQQGQTPTTEQCA